MLDRIFDEWLQQHTGNNHIERGGIEILHHAQFVGAEAYYFDVEIVVDELDFLPQRDE